MSPVEKIIKSVFAAMPMQTGRDVRTNIEAAMRSRLESLNLVSREEFEIQQKILGRTREKVDALQDRLTALEKTMNPEQ